MTSFKVEWEVKSSNPRHRTTVKEGEGWVSNFKLWQPSLATPPPYPPQKKKEKKINLSISVMTMIIIMIIKRLLPAGPSTLLILLNLRALFGNLIGMLQQHQKTAQS